jgi:acetolactate synthase I/II/III large subunit
MNNNAVGTIARLQQAHYGLTYGTTFPSHGSEYMPNYADVARAYGIEGVRIRKAAEFKPALKKAIESGKSCVIDVAMRNNPTPTAGHWNIMDIYSPGKKVHHAATP